MNCGYLVDPLSFNVTTSCTLRKKRQERPPILKCWSMGIWNEILFNLYAPGQTYVVVEERDRERASVERNYDLWNSSGGQLSRDGGKLPWELSGTYNSVFITITWISRPLAFFNELSTLSDPLHSGTKGRERYCGPTAIHSFFTSRCITYIVPNILNLNSFTPSKTTNLNVSLQDAQWLNLGQRNNLVERTAHLPVEFAKKTVRLVVRLCGPVFCETSLAEWIE